MGFNPARVMADVDERYRTPRGEFIPANFDRVAQGPISMREALGNSLNLSAVSLLNQIGPPAFYDLLTRLQLINHPERPAEYYGLGLVVGNPEVSLMQLASAYACLANGGVFRPVRFIRNDGTGRSDTAATPHPDPLPSRGEGDKKEAAISCLLQAARRHKRKFRSRFFLPRPLTLSAISWPIPWPGPGHSAPLWPCSKPFPWPLKPAPAPIIATVGPWGILPSTPWRSGPAILTAGRRLR